MQRSKLKYIIIAAIFMVFMFPFIIQAQTTSVLLPSGTVEGRLPNGLRYLILQNPSPAARIEFRLVMQVGSVQESEQEKGSAHFLEHVAFGGTTHFPKRSLVEYLESLGMRYGQDINAFTGFDRTIYMFAVPVDQQKEKVIDRSLLILRDWLDGICMDSVKVENEKGIILEELRGYDLGDDFYSLKIGQGIFSQRMPLGTAEDIRKVTPQALEAYYQKWYVPSLATLIVVGDISPKEIETKIKNRFSLLEKRIANGFRNYPLEYTKGIHLSEIRDSLQTKTKIELMIPHPCVVEHTMEDAVLKKMGKLLVRAVSSRFHGRHLKASVADHWYLSDKNHLILTVEGAGRSELLAAISATVAELNGLISNGWAVEELEDIKDDFLDQMQSPIGSLSRSSSAWCDDFVDYVISGDRYLTDITQQEELKAGLIKVDSSSLQILLKRWLSYYKEALLVACRSHAGLGDPLTKEEIVHAWEKGEPMNNTVYAYVRRDKKEETKIVTPPCLALRQRFDSSFITHIVDYPQTQIREVKLKNGIRLILKPTHRADTTLLLTSFAPLGTSSLSDEKYPLLEGVGYIDMGGLAKVEGAMLSDYLFQRGISLTMAMENHWHGFIGMASVANASEFFNLIYEKIFDPELKYDDFEDIRQELLKSYGNETILEKMLKRAPGRLLSARMHQLMGSAMPRSSNKLSVDQINSLNLDSIAAFYKELYTRPEETTYVICGNFNSDTIMRQFVSVFGRIPASLSSSEHFYSRFELPTKKIIEGFSNDNETQTLFDYLFFGYYQPSLKSTLTLKLMRDVIRNRLIAVLRERESLVYSPYISLMYEGIPWRTFYFDINASADNCNMPEIDVLLKEILRKLQLQEVNEDELNNIKRSFLIAKREALNEETPSNWRTAIVGLLKNGESLEDFERYEQCLESITPATLRDSFNRHISLENYSLLYLSKNKMKNETKNN